VTEEAEIFTADQITQYSRWISVYWDTRQAGARVFLAIKAK